MKNKMIDSFSWGDKRKTTIKVKIKTRQIQFFYIF